MCGICGAVGDGRRADLTAMSSCQEHRGPESTGVHRDGDVRLANQRLRVIDVEGGDQPIYNEDGDVVVVYNGEIYNFRALRRELEAAGHAFTTATDTEVLVHGYEEWGTDLFGRLNGMFAVALYDAGGERLLLGRDRAGIKPLYYATVDGGLLFGSEPKALLRSGAVEPAVDADALAYFLQLRYSPSHTSLFEGIETVLPGTYLDVRREGDTWKSTTHQFWSVRDVPSSPPDDPAAAIRETLGRAVERQLISDVPVGFYLSGGLDTSSVVAMASELSDDPIHTFCMGFESTEWDERNDARVVADYFGTTHHEFDITGSFLEDFPELIWHADEPKRNLWPYYVAEEMGRHVTVALGGLGADELFGGYIYRFNRLADCDELQSVGSGEAAEWIQQVGTRALDQQVARGDLADDDAVEPAGTLANLDDPAQLYVLLNSTDVLGPRKFYETRAFGEALTDRPDPPAVVRARSDPEDDASLREQALQWDFTVKLPDDFLFVEDRMSMAHSLESRVPFLDNEMIDLAFSLPLSEAFDRGGDGPTVGKRLLREAMRDELPETVFRKDKQGFTMPTYPFVRDEMLEHARAILDDPYLVRNGYVQASYLRDLLSRTPDRALTGHYKLLWKLVGAEIWYQMYMVGDVHGPEALSAYYT